MRSVLDRELIRIHRAAVHLVPDQSIPSEESGTRHGTADGVARQRPRSVREGLTRPALSTAVSSPDRVRKL